MEERHGREGQMTTGEWMFYGGIAGAAVFFILLAVVLATSGKSRRRMINKIQKESEL